MNLKKWTFGLYAALLSAALSAQPVEVVASFSILGDVAREIGGDRVKVSTLVGPDQDAHAYQLNSRDLRTVRDAKLVLVNGLGFEQAAVMRGIRQSDTPYAEAARGIEPLKNEEHHHEHGHGHDHHHEHGHHHGHSHGEHDPHVWSDPVLMRRYAQNVAEALIRTDPDGASHYRQRLGEYQNRLDGLHRWAQSRFAAVPQSRRKVLIGHHSFGYLGHRYRVEFIAPQGISTDAQPSARQVAALIRQIREQNIRAAFSENIKDARMVERIARETGIRINGKLYTDALSRDPQADSYEKMFRHNVNALVEAMKQ